MLFCPYFNTYYSDRHTYIHTYVHICCSDETDRSGELSYKFFFISNGTLIRWVTLELDPLTVILTVLVICIYFCPLTLIFFLQWLSLLENSSVVWVSINFTSNSKGNAPFHRIAVDYSCVDWDGLRHENLRQRFSIGWYLWTSVFIPTD